MTDGILSVDISTFDECSDCRGGQLDLFVFAALAGVVAVASGGIEAALAFGLLHLVCAAAVGLTAETGDDAAWQYVLHVGAMALFAVGAVWLARRLNIQTATTAEPPTPSSAPPAAELDTL